MFSTEPTPSKPAPAVNSHVERPLDKLSRAVLSYSRLIGTEVDFRMDDLNKYIEMLKVKCAPDSPGRILRMLRNKELLDYEVVNRAQSRYRFKEIS